MVDEMRLLRDLENARIALVAAWEDVARMPETSAHHDKAMVSYLHAYVTHMSLASALQARQHQLLTAEVDELRKRVEGQEPPAIEAHGLNDRRAQHIS